MRAAEAYARIHHDPTANVTGFDPTICASAMRLYEERRDKEWGITDCFSFEVMRVQKLAAALTADHHFEQAGYTALLQHDPTPPS